MERILDESISTDSETQVIVWAVILLFLGVFYMFGFVYYIYKKFLSIIFEDLICLLDGRENEETYRPIVYSMLNSLQFLILSFFSTLNSESNLGLAVIIGSDSFNTFFILGLIFVKFKDANHGVLDTWITFRDAIIYIIGLITMVLFLVNNFVNLYAVLILICYYIINYWVLSANQDIKEKVMEWLGLNNEDNEFNSDEHFHCKKRRESSTQLKEAGCFDPSDADLNKRLNRMEALLVIKFQTNGLSMEKKKLQARFQKAVYQIIFGLINLTKFDKLKRSEQYMLMYKPKQQTRSRQQFEDPDIQSLKEDLRDTPIQSGQSNEIAEQDNDPLIQDKDSQDKDVNEDDGKQESSLAKADEQPNQQHSDQAHDESYGDEGVSIKMPKSIGGKILYVIFFPIHLILYLFPNYLENPIPKKLVLCFFLNIILLSGCMYLIDSWLWQISDLTSIPFDVLGITFGGIFLSIHFLEYNFKVAKEEKQLEFVQSFFQIGICKISLCPAIPWAFKVLINLDINVRHPTTFGFFISIAIFGVMILLFLIIAILSRFKIKAEEGVKMGVLYVMFIVASTVIIVISI